MKGESTLLRWNTFWGRRLPQESGVKILIFVVFALTILPSFLGLLGWLQFSPGFARLLYVLLGWTSATFAWIIVIFAFGRSGTDRHQEALLLICALPMASLFDAARVFVDWAPLGLEDPTSTMLLLWTLARTLSSTTLVAVGLLVLYSPDRSQRDFWCAVVGISGAGIALLTAFVGTYHLPPPQWISSSLLLPRPWDLPPLLFFLFAGLWILPQIHRKHPNILSHALIVSMIPQIFAQLETALGAERLFDTHFLLGHLHQLTALTTLLGGILLDYVYTQRSREHAMHDIETAQQEIRQRTQELARVDRELGEQDLKRREAERSLRILEMAVETMSMGVTVTDLEGKILYTNPADAEMHGYTVEELRGKSATCFAPPAHEPERRPTDEVVQPWSRERINVTREGVEFPVRLVSNLVRHGGEPIAHVTICEDISERKRIEAALERRDRILEAIGFAAERFLADAPWETSLGEVLESLKAATGVQRIEIGQVDDPSRAMRRLNDTWSALDNSVEEAVQGAIPLPAAGPLLPRWREVLRHGGTLYGRVADLPAEEQRLLTRRGVRTFAIVPIFVSSIWIGVLSLEDEDDQREWSQSELEVLRTAARTFGAAIRRKQDEAALAASQAKFQDLLQNANDLVQSVSPVGRFQFVNRAWKEALGYREEEVTQLTLWNVIRPDFHASYTQVMSEIMASGQARRVEVVFVTKDGREIHLEGNLNCRFVDGQPMATRGIFRDITERKLIDRMKQEFISTVSHELRTPLTSIIASLGLLQSGRLDLERSNELLVVAYRNGQRLLQLINDLLDLQKLALGKIVFRTVPVDVAEVLDEALDGIDSYAESFQIDLSMADIPEGLKVMADRDRLMQVLNNLLSNAIKFSPAEEVVTVGARQDGYDVVLWVADNGAGIPKDFEKRLFEKFTQVDSSATRSSGGSGLGLSIVKGLVEGMGGAISLESELGEGTTFFVRLPGEDEPVTDEVPIRRSIAAASESETGDRFAEDEADTR